MIRKICMFVLVFIFSSAVFSANDFNVVMSSFEYYKNNQNLENSNVDKNDFAIRELATAYINVANTLSSKDCLKLQKLYSVVKSKEAEFAFDYIQATYNNEEFDLKSYKKFGCKTLSDDEINYVLLQKLIGKGVSLYKTAILGGDIESVSILLNHFKNDPIPFMHYHQIDQISELDNPYINFLIGQLYLDGDFFYRDPKKARELFEKAKDTRHDEVWYFLAFAKIEEMIELGEESFYKLPFLYDGYKDRINHAEIIKQIEEMLAPNDILHTLHLSYYYADDNKLNKAIEYFERACAIKPSSACDLYKQELKRPKKNKIYSLFLQFDKTNPNVQKSVEIAKWYEDVDKKLTAINYYSYVVDKEPELLLKIAELFKRVDIKPASYLDDILIKIYTKYDSYVDSAEIKYKIFSLYDSLSLERTPERNKISMDWLEKSAKAGFSDAKLKMAELFKSGNYFTEDYIKALYWYSSYCNSLDDGGYYVYYCPLFVNKENKMVDLVAKAAKGDRDAQYKLGEKLVDLKNLHEIGLYYLELAAGQGHKEAQVLYLIKKNRRWICFSC